MASHILQNQFVTRERAINNLLEYARENRENATYNDVIVVVRNEKIFANKLVLGCFSPFFEKKLKDLKKVSCIIEMEMDVRDVDILRQLIDYFYTGSISINDDNVSKILEQAHFLKLNEVMQFCFEYLQERINSENCFFIHAQAKLYGNVSLECIAANFINYNFQIIINLTSFKQLNKTELLECLLRSTDALVPAAFVYKAAVSWTKYDLESRGINFGELLKLIDFDQLSFEFLQTVVAIEELVQNDFACTQLVLQYMKSAYDKENEDKARVLISFGGIKTPTKVFQVNIHHSKNPTEFPELPIPLSCHIALLLGDAVYCIGGRAKKNDKASKKVWQMKLQEQHLTWSKVASMNNKRCVMGAATLKDCIVVAGGDDGKNCLPSSELFIPSLNVWQTIAPMNHARSGNALVECKNKLFAIGGWCGGNCLSSVECISDLKGQWAYIAPMNEPRRWLAAVNCNDVIYAIGGKSGDGNDKNLKSVEKYNPVTEKWSFVSNMTIARSSHAAAAVDGKIYAVGGLDFRGCDVRKIECYDPSKDSWSVVGETPCALFHNSLVCFMKLQK